MKPSIKQLTEKYTADMISLRRTLHQYPELSGEEWQTSRKIQEKLQSLGIPYTTGYAKTGVLGVIEGGRPGKTVALRADIDALPIQEENDHPYVSKVKGRMHACGHDAHTAMLVGVGAVLNEVKDELPGRVLLVFQPAEENAPVGGSEPMMADGVFEQYEPDVIFGQHVWPDLPVGQIGVRAGAMMGASDRFKVVIEGAGGHASMPHQTTDAIMVAHTVISNLQTIVSRNIDPLDAAVLTVGRIEGGSRYNVIADKVTFEGTIRTFQPETRQLMKERFHAVVTQGAAAMGAVAHIDYWQGYAATINTPRWANQVQQTAQNMLGPASTPAVQPSLGGEDFSRFLMKYPGAFFWLGTALPGVEQQKPLHDAQFRLDEEALPVGMSLMAQTAVDTLYALEKEDKEEKEEKEDKEGEIEKWELAK
ncbi:M20 metallopeptidase family protein [Caldalkalibacillus salinus]|uniref:M20 metallopeptidase family protein n=1 Tax=Caldalkalibacillus salinus TaxID=2803787 RepID=UPI00192475FB|nr:M20 family metallopeptidase [Caldalkalibacillus salinus]